MKKMCTLVALLAATLGVSNAQDLSHPTSLRVFDNEGVLTDRYQYRYDANGNQIEEIDFSGEEAIGNMKRNYSYNNDGQLLTSTAQKMVDGKWVDYSKNQLTYNADGSLACECNYLWMDGAWKPSSKTEIAYRGSDVIQKLYNWSGAEWELIVTDVTSQVDGLTDCVYDDKGNLTSRISYNLNEYDVRENSYKIEYSYDALGRTFARESYFWKDNQWMLDSTERYDYAETATCLKDIASVDKSAKKVLSNGRVNIVSDRSTFQINGVEE